ncbi:uncharacterized protein LOC135935205 [Cloeon dipterum]|uniref:uncharacterized protein LOC135935205 n=1 Tax=Cloeon dipterum TaxID=197152 RepID=UPI00321F77D5
MAIRERIAWYLTKYGAKYIATRKNSVMRESSEFDGLSSKEILARMVEKIKAEDESPKKKCITKRVAEDVKAGRGPEKKKKSKMERADVRMQISKSPALDTKSMAGASKKISSCEESADSDEDRSISTPVKKVKPKRKKTSARDSDENSLSPADAESDGSSCSTKSKSGRPKQTKMKHLDGNLKKEFARLLCSSSSDDES